MSAERADVTPRKAKGPISPGLLKTLRDCADHLDHALNLRCGQMDSESRRDEVMREQRAIVAQVSSTLRALT